MDTRIPLAGDEYLKHIGQIVYSIGYLEWLLLGDIASSNNVPMELSVENLSTKTTKQIANVLKKISAEDIENDQFRAWLARGGEYLAEIAELRNDILHARPATHENGSQMLYRWTARSNEQFFIDQSKLEELNQFINNAMVELNADRPLLLNKKTA